LRRTRTLAIAKLDEEERQNVYPFFPKVSTVEELAERATALSFSDVYGCVVNEDMITIPKGKMGKEKGMEARGREDEQLRALVSISKAGEHELDDPNVFDVSKYSCSCGNECAKKFPRERFVRLLHSCCGNEEP
jgi:hypothetical protein